MGERRRAPRKFIPRLGFANGGLTTAKARANNNQLGQQSCRVQWESNFPIRQAREQRRRSDEDAPGVVSWSPLSAGDIEPRRPSTSCIYSLSFAVCEVFKHSTVKQSCLGSRGQPLKGMAARAPPHFHPLRSRGNHNHQQRV